MKIAISLLTLFIAFPCNAVSFHAPQSTQEKNEFQKAQNYLNQIQQLNDLRTKQLNDFIANKKNGVSQVENHTQQRLVLYNEAIRAVIAAYGISPKHETGTLVAGAFKGSEAKAWDPMFDDRSARDSLNKDGQDVSMRPPPGVSLTWADGQVTLGEGSFFGGTEHPYFASPALLAASIIHETVHYEQYTTPGRRDNMTHFDMEIEAYSIELASAKEIGLTPGEVRLIGQGMTTGLHWVHDNPHASLFTAPSVLGDVQLADDDIEPMRENASLEFINSYQKQASELAEEARDRLAKDQDRKQKEEQERKEKEEWARMHPPEWEALKEWTQVACSYTRLDDYLIHQKLPDDDVDRNYLLTHLVVMAKKDMIRFEANDKADLLPCQIEMINLLLKADDPVDVAWLVNKFDNMRQGGAHSIIMRRIQNGILDIIIGIPYRTVKGISKAFTAIGDAITSLPSQSGGSSGEENRGNNRSNGSGNSGSRRDGSNFHYNDGEAASQLRGIASDSMGFDN